MQTITIGKIVKPQGIRGAVKVLPFTENMHRFGTLPFVYIDNQKVAIQQVTYGNNFVILKLENVDDRNMAENFRNKLVSIDRSDIQPPQDGFLIIDLMGASVVDECGSLLGTITDIDAFGAADVIACKATNGKEFRFPHLEHVVKEVDISAKTFCVYKNLWQEVVVFDD